MGAPRGKVVYADEVVPDRILSETHVPVDENDWNLRAVEQGEYLARHPVGGLQERERLQHHTGDALLDEGACDFRRLDRAFSGRCGGDVAEEKSVSVLLRTPHQPLADAREHLPERKTRHDEPDPPRLQGRRLRRESARSALAVD